MAEDRASNSSTSTDNSAATDKTQPSPSRVVSMPLTSPVSTPLKGNAVVAPPSHPATRFTASCQWMVPHPSQAATTLLQLVSTGNNRTVFLEMSRQMPTSSSPVNNTVESLAVFRQQIEESHHDLVNLLTQQMATVLIPMIENNNDRIDQMAQQVNELAENFNPQPPRQQMYNHRNPPVILARGDPGNRGQVANVAQAYGTILPKLWSKY
ncbi:hypothetical protein PIB30_068425 [Stylosanthes scabra]|uniref:Uncharacterized protein n=1 Tax=Stylosanthes scabra TaxID=79078 RepID=A0ABU6TPH0_9FABA|nr:hypothetical protein [Stylosanthes scabra]